jgi:diacylglycerol O-acyltransferase
MWREEEPVSELKDALRGVNDMRAVGEQMTGFDAATWRAAVGDRGARSVILGLLVLDSAPDWERFRARWERLTRVVPILRKRAILGGLGLSAPRLAVDADFDLDIHLRRMRLAEGVEWVGVLDEARRMSLTDFDRDRPLWESVLIEGLPGGRAVIILKIHHAIGDGQSILLMGANLFELTPEGNPEEPEAPEAPEGEVLSVATVSGANIQDNALRALEAAKNGAAIAAKLVKGTLKSPVETWSNAMNVAGSMTRFAAVPEAGLSPVMTERSTTYTFRVFQTPFADIKAASKRYEYTVNDVFLAACSTGLANYHDRHGKPARQLRFNIPISLRSATKDGSAANAVTIARFPLPVNGVSVAERLEAAHIEVKRWRDEPALALVNPMADVSWLIPVPVLAHTMRTSDVTLSNVPGPPFPIYIAGSKMIGQWPLVATIGAATNITMVTYDGYAFIGISADDEAVTDIDNLMSDLKDGFSEVLGVPVGSENSVDQSGSKGRSKTKGASKASAKSGGSAKKPAAKKPAAKKAATKKPAAKKPAAKKPAAKKPAAKKAAGTKKTSKDDATAKKSGAE